MFKLNKKMLFWGIAIAVVVIIAIYFGVIWYKRYEGLDASTKYLMGTIGGNQNTQDLMSTSIPADFASVSKHDLAEDDALNFYNDSEGEPMRINKSLSYQDAMINRYSRLKEMMY